MNLTYHTLLKDKAGYLYLDDLGVYVGKLERELFSWLFFRKIEGNIKTNFSAKHNITSRQYNALLYNINAKVKSNQEKRSYDIECLKEKIEGVEVKIAEKREEKSKLHKKLLSLKPKTEQFHKVQKKYAALKRYIHTKGQKLIRLYNKLAKLEKDESDNKIRICFGSKKRFNAQYHLKKNGYVDHSEWKKDWTQARSSNVYILGSKDETYGNQSCTYDLANNLRIRTHGNFEKTYGKYVTFQNVLFPYGQDQVDQCKKKSGIRVSPKGQKTNLYQAITYTLVRKEKGWYVHAAIEVEEADIVTSSLGGIVSIDLNDGFISVSELDRFGNPIANFDLPVLMQNRSSEQTEAAMSDALNVVVTYAKEVGKNIGCEYINFAKKKARLKENGGKKYRRMLSNLSFSMFKTQLETKCKKEGVKLIQVSPAYTSQIGHVKFMKRYGLSSHGSAAVVIGRRAMKLKVEKLNYKTALGSPKKVNLNAKRFSQWVAFTKFVKKKYTFKNKIRLLKIVS
jgi:IS605 OrfB family transposase